MFLQNDRKNASNIENCKVVKTEMLHFVQHNTKNKGRDSSLCSEWCSRPSSWAVFAKYL